MFWYVKFRLHISRKHFKYEVQVNLTWNLGCPIFVSVPQQGCGYVFEDAFLCLVNRKNAKFPPVTGKKGNRTAHAMQRKAEKAKLGELLQAFKNCKPQVPSSYFTANTVHLNLSSANQQGEGWDWRRPHLSMNQSLESKTWKDIALLTRDSLPVLITSMVNPEALSCLINTKADGAHL